MSDDFGRDLRGLCRPQEEIDRSHSAFGKLGCSNWTARNLTRERKNHLLGFEVYE
jgi:hypothetical protein